MNLADSPNSWYNKTYSSDEISIAMKSVDVDVNIHVNEQATSVNSLLMRL